MTANKQKVSPVTINRLLTEQRDTLMSLYESGYTVYQLKLELKVSGEALSAALKSIYGADVVEANRYKRVAAKSKAYTGNRSHPKPVEKKEWYAVVKAPDWFTGAIRPNGYIYEHTKIYCEHNGLTEVPAYHVIHHIDLDPHNNAPNNLQMMTRSAHMALHVKLRSNA